MIQLSRGDKLVSRHQLRKLPETASWLDLMVSAVIARGACWRARRTVPLCGERETEGRSRLAASSLAALPMNSGLSVAALNGAPGIHSARWAGPKKDFRWRWPARRRMRNSGNPASGRISYACCLVAPGEETRIFEAGLRADRLSAARTIRLRLRPIFIPEGHRFTFAELTPSEARDLHRAKAFEKFVKSAFHRP